MHAIGKDATSGGDAKPVQGIARLPKIAVRGRFAGAAMFRCIVVSLAIFREVATLGKRRGHSWTPMITKQFVG